MGARVIVIIIMFVFVAVLMSGYAQESEQKAKSEETETIITTSTKVEVTAREALDIAETVVRDWASDEVLVDLTNFRGSSLPDGGAVRWKLEFNSVSMKKELEVHVSRGKILQKNGREI